MLFDRSNPLCIEDFYILNNRIYYQSSSDNIWRNSGTNYQVQYIHPNYQYDSDTGRCNPNLSYILGMEETDFNFLLGLMGLIIGSTILYFIVGAFVTVGGKR